MKLREIFKLKGERFAAGQSKRDCSVFMESTVHWC